MKQYIEGGVYHVYNRGVNSSDLFFSEGDFEVFMWYLNRYLFNEDSASPLIRRIKNYYGKVNLLSFCLVRNHIHLLLQQKGLMDMSRFMQSLIISYTSYINRKYKRTGCLFEGTYRARFVEDDSDLANMSKYVHRNGGDSPREILNYPFSSVSSYVGGGKRWDFVDASLVLQLYGYNMKLYEKYILEV